jgi:Zn-dependent peptidase ImmA (M78 family)
MGRTGISDPFVRKNIVERRCNRFAASFLIPQPYVATLLGTSVTKTPDLEDVRWAARKLKISQEATVLRLEQLGLYSSGTHERWRALVHNENPDFSEAAVARNRHLRKRSSSRNTVSVSPRHCPARSMRVPSPRSISTALRA